IIADYPVAAGILGKVEPGVGECEQGCEIGYLAAGNTGADRDLAAIGAGAAQLECGAQALGEQHCRAERSAGTDDDEFIPAIAKDTVRGANALDDDLSDGLEHRIPAAVAEPVV